MVLFHSELAEGSMRTSRAAVAAMKGPTVFISYTPQSLDRRLPLLFGKGAGPPRGARKEQEESLEDIVRAQRLEPKMSP